MSKTLMMQFLGDDHGHHKCDKCRILHDGSTRGALPIHTTFRDLDHISKSQQCQTV